MKFLQRSFCVVLCLVISLAVFSADVKADELDGKAYHYYVSTTVRYNGAFLSGITAFTFAPNDGELDLDNKSFSLSGTGKVVNIRNEYTLANDDNSALLKQGESATITIENLNELVHWKSTTSEGNIYVPEGLSVSVRYVDGTTGYFSGTIAGTTTGTNLKISIDNAEKDITRIIFTTVTDVSSDGVLTSVELERGDDQSDTACLLTIKVKSPEQVEQEETNGLLGGVLDLLTDLWDTLTGGFEDIILWVSSILEIVQDGFNDVWTWFDTLSHDIIELPSNLWNVMSEGLRSLFVPDELDIINIQQDWDFLLQVKFGAVYQVGSYIFDLWRDIEESDETNSVPIPEVSIPLPEETSFTFGGYSVQIVPNGFEWLAGTVKTATGIACTFLFINGLRKRYDEVMGVEQ